VEGLEYRLLEVVGQVGGFHEGWRSRRKVRQRAFLWVDSDDPDAARCLVPVAPGRKLRLTGRLGNWGNVRI
jgi:hypothetical protein